MMPQSEESQEKTWRHEPWDDEVTLFRGLPTYERP